MDIIFSCPDTITLITVAKTLIIATVIVDIFACINFRGFMKLGNFACIKIRVLCKIGCIGYYKSNFRGVHIFADI